MEESIRIGLLIDQATYKELVELVPDGEKSKLMRHLLRLALTLLRSGSTNTVLGAIYDGKLSFSLSANGASDEIKL